MLFVEYQFSWFLMYIYLYIYGTGPFLYPTSILLIKRQASVVFVLCLVYTMLPVSLDCPFVIASSVFSNIHLHVWTQNYVQTSLVATTNHLPHIEIHCLYGLQIYSRYNVYALMCFNFWIVLLTRKSLQTELFDLLHYHSVSFNENYWLEC